jgi:hypothetical protein
MDPIFDYIRDMLLILKRRNISQQQHGELYDMFQALWDRAFAAGVEEATPTDAVRWLITYTTCSGFYNPPMRYFNTVSDVPPEEWLAEVRRLENFHDHGGRTVTGYEVALVSAWPVDEDYSLRPDDLEEDDDEEEYDEPDSEYEPYEESDDDVDPDETDEEPED